MTDEEKNKEAADAAEPEEGKTSSGKSKSGLIKYIIFGIAGLVLVVVIAFGTLMLMGGEEPSVQVDQDDSEEITAVEQSEHPHEPEPQDDSQTEELSQDVLDKIMENLAVLDYEPDLSEVEGEEIVMSAEDSIEAVNWLEQEKAALAVREADLSSREKELQRLDLQVTQKILRIEQVESSRIASLAKLYDGMDSRSVAQLMANLDDETVVSILPRMKIKNASAVLQLLPPQRGAKLSKRMITIAEK
ncbi:MAG: hypothetical protein ABII79_13595 [bacterium]